MAGLVGAGVFPMSSPHLLSLQTNDGHGQNGHSGMGMSHGDMGDDRVLGETSRLGDVSDMANLGGRVSVDGENVADMEETESKHWSREATEVLIEAWSAQQGEGHKNLSQNHWQAVVDAVNNRRGGGKPKKNINQCKHRIDTLKKVYKKLRKARTKSTSGDGVPWPYFELMEYALNVRANYRVHLDAEMETNKVQGVGQEGVDLLRGGGGGGVGVSDMMGGGMGGVGMGGGIPGGDTQDPFGTQRVADIFRARKRARLESQEGSGSLHDVGAAIAQFSDIYKRVEHTKLEVMSRVEQNRSELLVRLEEIRMKAHQDLEQMKVQSRMELEVKREEVHLRAALEREKFEESKKLGKEQIEERIALEREQIEVRKLEIQLELEKLRMRKEGMDGRQL